ncbi:MAG: hypothetical protein HY822_06955 [Acidobacteria bacterium]|nr:hypothetical protein [Acidobacteriota bacterium]
MFWNLAGGLRGAAVVVLLALAGILVPMKFGALFLDPAILLAYNGVAFLLAANFTVRGALGCREEPRLRQLAWLGTFYGWACWAVVLGVALAALAQWRGRLLLPAAALGVALAALAGAVSWLASTLACVAALNVQTERAARDLMRLGFFFILLLAIAGPRLLPVEWQENLRRFLSGGPLASVLLAASALLVLIGAGALRHTRTLIEDRKASLSITGE